MCKYSGQGYIQFVNYFFLKYNALYYQYCGYSFLFFDKPYQYSDTSAKEDNSFRNHIR